MFLALFSASSMTALSFWFTWIATLCSVLAAALPALLGAVGLLCAGAGAPATSIAARAVAAATRTARVGRRAMVIAYSLDRPAERKRIFEPTCAANGKELQAQSKPMPQILRIRNQNLPTP